MERRSERIFGQRYGDNHPVRIADLNDHLMCGLCCGYFIDATTIIECLHSFCRACIVQYLEKNSRCPVCNIVVHKAQPLLNIRLDHVLQGLVYKLVPGLLMKEMNKRRSFYIHGLQSKAVDRTKDSETRGTLNLSGEHNGQRLASSTKPGSSDSECFSISLEYCPSFRLNESAMETSDIASQFVDVRYLLCPAPFTVGCLKKFIRAKFDLSLVYEINILFNHEYLENHLSMLDVAFICQWQKRMPLKLFYTVSFTPRTKRKALKEISSEDQEEDSPKKQNKSTQASSSTKCEQTQMLPSSCSGSVQTDSLRKVSAVASLKAVKYDKGGSTVERLPGDSSGSNQKICAEKIRFRNGEESAGSKRNKLQPNTTTSSNVVAALLRKPVNSEQSCNIVHNFGGIFRKSIQNENVNSKLLNSVASASSVLDNSELVIDLTLENSRSPVSVAVLPGDSVIGLNSLEAKNCSLSSSNFTGASVTFLGNNCTGLLGNNEGGTWGLNLDQLAAKSVTALPCVGSVNCLKSLPNGLSNHFPYLPSADSSMSNSMMKILPPPEVTIVPSFGVQILYSSDALIPPNPIYGVIQLTDSPAVVESDPFAQGRSWNRDVVTENGIMNDADFQRLCEGKTEQEKNNIMHCSRNYGQFMISTMLDKTGREPFQNTSLNFDPLTDHTASAPLPCVFVPEGIHDHQNSWSLCESARPNDRVMWNVCGPVGQDLSTMDTRTLPGNSILARSTVEPFSQKAGLVELPAANFTPVNLNYLGGTMAGAGTMTNIFDKERNLSYAEPSKTSEFGTIHLEYSKDNATMLRPECERNIVLDRTILENCQIGSYLLEDAGLVVNNDSNFVKVCTVEPLTDSVSASEPPKRNVIEEFDVTLLPVKTSSRINGVTVTEEKDDGKTQEDVSLGTINVSSVEDYTTRPLEVVSPFVRSSLATHLIDLGTESCVTTSINSTDSTHHAIERSSNVAISVVRSKPDVISNLDDAKLAENTFTATTLNIASVEAKISGPNVRESEKLSVENIASMEPSAVGITVGNPYFSKEAVYEKLVPADNGTLSTGNRELPIPKAAAGPYVQETGNKDIENLSISITEMKEFHNSDCSEVALQSTIIESPESEVLKLDDHSMAKVVAKEISELPIESSTFLSPSGVMELDGSSKNTHYPTDDLASSVPVVYLAKLREDGENVLPVTSESDATRVSPLLINVSDAGSVSQSLSSCCHVVNVSHEKPCHNFESRSEEAFLQNSSLRQNETVPADGKYLTSHEDDVEGASISSSDVSSAVDSGGTTEQFQEPDNFVVLDMKKASSSTITENISENFQPAVIKEQRDFHGIDVEHLMDGANVNETEETETKRISISNGNESSSAEHNCVDLSLEMSLPLIDNLGKFFPAKNTKTAESGDSEDITLVNSVMAVVDTEADTFSSIAANDITVSVNGNCLENSPVVTMSVETPTVEMTCSPFSSPNSTNNSCSMDSTCKPSSVLATESQIMSTGVEEKFLFVANDQKDFNTAEIFPVSAVSESEELYVLSAKSVLETPAVKTLPLFCDDPSTLQNLSNCLAMPVVSSFGRCVDVVQVDTASLTCPTDQLFPIQGNVVLTHENSFRHKIDSCDSELQEGENTSESCKTPVDLFGNQNKESAWMNKLNDDTQKTDASDDLGSESVFVENIGSSVDDLNRFSLKLCQFRQLTPAVNEELSEKCSSSIAPVADVGHLELHRNGLFKFDNTDRSSNFESCISTISRSISFGNFDVSASDYAAFDLRVRRRRWKSLDGSLRADKCIGNFNAGCTMNPLCISEPDKGVFIASDRSSELFNDSCNLETDNLDCNEKSPAVDTGEKTDGSVVDSGPGII